MNPSISRRRALTGLLQAVAMVPPATLFARVAWAQDLPLLALDDPMAKALGYVEDTTTVDAAKYPKHTAEQNCANCQFIQGEEGADARPCTLFPGKSVKATGWCVSWVKKA
jgi:hypothetical protein